VCSSDLKCNNNTDNKNEKLHCQMNFVLTKINNLENKIKDEEKFLENKTVISLLKEIVNDNKEMKEQFLKINEQQAITNYNNNNSINSFNNNTFNLNNFLTVQCKDAPSLVEFINSIPYSYDNLKYIEQNGLLNGFKNDIINKLLSTEQTMRPIHTTDRKRNIMYYKDSTGIWVKDTDECCNISIRCYTNNVFIELGKWRNHIVSIGKYDDDNCDFFHQTNSIICRPSYNNEFAEVFCKNVKSLYSDFTINKKLI